MAGDPTAGVLGADPTAGAPTDPSTDDQGTDQGTVLCTIVANSDGTYQLIQGDEDDSGSAGDQDAGAPPGGAAPPDMAAGDLSSGGADQTSQGQQFDSVGALLKGLLDLLKQHESQGSGSEDDNFDAGFTGSDAPTMKQPPANMRT